MIQHQRNINMYPGVRAPERIHLSQYDSDFTLVFSLYSSAGSFSVDSGTTAMIRGTKGDGNGYSANASLSGTTVTVQGNNQMTAVAGPNTFELVLTRSGNVLSTANFILDVEPAAMDADTIQSETVLKELQAIIDSASTSTAAATRAEEAAQEAEGHANGTIRFDIVQSKTEAEKAQARQNIGFETDNTLTVQGVAADAKKVGDEITGLKDDFNHIDDALGIYYSDVSLWESGGINLPDGQEWETTTRIRTGYIPRTSEIIKPASGYQIGIYAYNSSNTYLGMYNGTDFSKSEPYWYSFAASITEIPASYKLRLLAKKDSGENISPSDATNILFGGSYTDKSLTMSDKAADAKATGDELRQSDTYQKLLCDDVPDTVQTYTFSAGSVSQVTHTKNGTDVRTDAFTYGESTITEVRTLSTGESLTIVTNLTTLETTVTYSAAA